MDRPAPGAGRSFHLRTRCLCLGERDIEILQTFYQTVREDFTYTVLYWRHFKNLYSQVLKGKIIQFDWRRNDMKKKTLAILLSAALSLGLLASCGGGNAGSGTSASKSPAAGAPAASTPAPAASVPAPAAPAQLSGSVVTNGSTSMEKTVKALIEGFKAVQPGVTVTYEPTGSGSGIEAASTGSADIGLASRGLKDEEKANLTETVVARDGIAVVVNTANPVDDLTVEQVAAIARGEITNWKDLGGGDEAIAFIGREAGSGTRSAFEELTGTEDACKYNQELTSTGAVITAVSSTPGAIGYASLSSVEDTVKAVKIGGVACTEATVLDGSYAIQRPFVFATLTGGTLSEAAQAFYDFAMDPANAELYQTAGVVPASAA